MQTFSFRAETIYDVAELIKEIPWKLNGRVAVEFRHADIDGVSIPDVDVELRCTHDYQEVLEAMERIDDAHVMIETLRECKLEDNSLKRSMNGGLF